MGDRWENVDREEAVRQAEYFHSENLRNLRVIDELHGQVERLRAERDRDRERADRATQNPPHGTKATWVWDDSPDEEFGQLYMPVCRVCQGGPLTGDELRTGLCGVESCQYGVHLSYDSAADTLRHIVRVTELLTEPVAELARRGAAHDRSKLEDPEKAVFDEFTPKLKNSTYGSDEYKSFLDAMGEGLSHHYRHNRHHPEYHHDGIAGMTLVDLIEMLADWKAATERHDDGDLARSLKIQQERFGISDQLVRILDNTARRYGWLALDGPDRRRTT